MNILIVYGTTEGHTAKIACRIREYVEASGHSADLLDSSSEISTIDPANHTGLIVAGSVHQGRYQESLTQFIQSHLSEIRRIPNTFLSVNLSMVTAIDSDEAYADVQKLVALTGWKPGSIKLVAGALKYTQYDFFQRQVMKLISKRRGMPTDTHEDHEFTDWYDLQNFITAFMNSTATETVI